MIKISDTNEGALKAYLKKLEAKGWEISQGNYESTARKGADTAQFNIQSKTWLQITVMSAKKGVWPKDKIPTALTQPKGCNLLDVGLHENYDDNMLFSFTCMGMSEAEANAYMNDLIKAGWEGDTNMVYINKPWRGKAHGISLELYEVAAGNASFVVNFGPEI